MKNSKKVSVYQEHLVTIGADIAGIFTMLESGRKSPAVLLLHGFASNKNEVGDLYKTLAQNLAEVGIVSLRIDFQTSRERLDEEIVLPMSRQIEMAALATQFLADEPTIDRKKLGVLGFSFGGGVAIELAGNFPDQFQSLATWSCVGDLPTSFKESLGEEIYLKASQSPITKIDLGWRSIQITNDFFEDLESYTPLASINNFKGSFFAIAGGQDRLASYVNTYVQNAHSASNKDQLIIDGADHTFNVLDPEKKQAQILLNKTVTWFENTLQ